MKLKLLFLLFTYPFLAACSNAATTTPTVASIGIMTNTAVSTNTAVPATATPLPTITLTPPPTLTPAPTQTATLTPTPTPTLAPVGIGTPIHQSSAVIAPENVSQLTELARWGRGVINDVAYSGNGRWIAIGTTTGVYIHDAQDLNIAPLFFETAHSVHAVDISFNGDLLAIGFGFHVESMELWRIADQQLLWAKNEEKVYDLQFSPDGQAIAISSNSGSGVIVWNAVNGEIIFNEENAFGIQFSADGTQLATWNYGTLSIYGWPNRELLSQTEPILYIAATEGEMEAGGTLISDVQFTANNVPILLNLPGNAAYGPTGRVEFQQGSDNELLLSLPPIEPLSWPIDGACDEPIFFADPPARPQVWQFELLPASQIVALKYDDVGFEGDDRSYTNVQFYQLESGNQLYIQEAVAGFAFSPDGETWVSGLQDGRLQIRRITNGELLQTFDGYESPVLSVEVSPDNQLVAVEYLDEVKLYQTADGTILQSYPAKRIAFSQDGSMVALGYENGRIEVRKTADNSLLTTLSANTEAIIALAFAPSSDKLISASMDCQLNIWQLPEGTLSSQLENYFMEHPFNEEEVLPARVWDMFVAPDGQWLIGQFLSSVGIWNLQNGAFHELLETEMHQIEGMAFSPSNNYLAVAGYPFLLWQLFPTEKIWQEGSGTTVTISPDGQLLVVGWDENFVDANIKGALELLLASNGEKLHLLTPGTRKVTALAFAPNGRFFVSASLDGVIRLWGVP